MSQPDDLVSARRLRASQIIAGALLFGLLSFCAIAMFIQTIQKPQPGFARQERIPIITYIALAMFVIQVPLSLFVPKIVTRTAVTKIVRGPADQVAGPGANLSDLLWAVYQSSLIVGLALLEGVGFLAGIGYLLEGSPWALGIMGAIVVLMLLRFPTPNRVQAWMLQQADLIEQLRQ